MIRESGREALRALGVTDDDLLKHNCLLDSILKAADRYNKQGKMLKRTVMWNNATEDILGRKYFSYGQVLDAPEGGDGGRLGGCDYEAGSQSRLSPTGVYTGETGKAGQGGDMSRLFRWDRW